MAVTVSAAATVVLAVVSGAESVGAWPVAAGLATGVATVGSLWSDMMNVSRFNPSERLEKWKRWKRWKRLIL